MAGCGQSGKTGKKDESISYHANWESLAEHRIPEWLMDAKFGIYAHWGIYSVPAYGNEWYAKRMYDLDQDIHHHHLETYGDPAEFGYKDFVPMFRAENYDPDEWAELIASSGARYAGFAVVHHDGFCLWDSDHTRWNSMDMGPGRDLYGELVKSLRKKENMKVIATFHHIRTFNWYLPYKPRFYEPIDEEIKARYSGRDWDIFDPEYADLYCNEEVGRTQEDFIMEWESKVMEVIDNYQPDVIWFDGGQFRDEGNSEVVTGLLSHYYNRGREWKKEVEVLNKLPVSMVFNFPEDVGMLTFEEGRDRPAIVDRPWVDDMKISDRSWGYVEGQKYKDPDVIIDGLIDRVSRGGGLVLSLCPKADGTINDEQKHVLREIGKWLEVNGAAIYGTRPWVIHAEGDEHKLRSGDQHVKWVFDNCTAEDIRFTSREGHVYAIMLGIPSDNEITIKSLGKSQWPADLEIESIRLHMNGADLSWEQKDNYLTVALPEDLSADYALVLDVEIIKH
jgi:alpha-L-fucosidase